ncbi:MAG: ribonuclease HI [Sphaerochaetaceae bacterium]|nr:ribonuclease HI [Sphaerochaetaceae bacterium]
MNEVIVYTDGGCSGNPGPGGWAFVVVDKSQVVFKSSGNEKATTNNRMELTAVINALKYAINKDGEKVMLITDSQYVKNGITMWIFNWKKNGWRTANKQPVKNQDLWKELDLWTEKTKVQWSWVKGHAGNTYNEMCDSMVRIEMDKIINE